MIFDFVENNDSFLKRNKLYCAKNGGGWFRWCSFSNRWFLGSNLIFRGVEMNHSPRGPKPTKIFAPFHSHGIWDFTDRWQRPHWWFDFRMAERRWSVFSVFCFGERATQKFVKKSMMYHPKSKKNQWNTIQKPSKFYRKSIQDPSNFCWKTSPPSALPDTWTPTWRRRQGRVGPELSWGGRPLVFSGSVGIHNP